VENVTKPVENGKEVVENVTKPVENGKEVVENVTKPVENGKEVVENVTKPVENGKEVVENVEKPVENGKEVAKNVAKPVENGNLQSANGHNKLSGAAECTSDEASTNCHQLVATDEQIEGERSVNDEINTEEGKPGGNLRRESSEGGFFVENDGKETANENQQKIINNCSNVETTDQVNIATVNSENVKTITTNDHSLLLDGAEPWALK